MRRLVWVGCLLVLMARPVAGQPNCRSVILPEPTGDPATISHHLFYATPPNVAAGEKWGHLEYPINYIPPANAVSVGLMYVMGQTYTVEGWQPVGLWNIRTDGYGQPIRWDTRYVMGRSGALYPHVRNGVRFAWYPVLARAAEHDPSTFRVTIDQPDGDGTGGIDNPLSTVLQLTEGVSLGVNVLWPYPEPILTMVALHLRECLLPPAAPDAPPH